MKFMYKYLEFCEIRFFCPQSMTKEDAYEYFSSYKSRPCDCFGVLLLNIIIKMIYIFIQIKIKISIKLWTWVHVVRVEKQFDMRMFSLLITPSNVIVI